MLASAALVRVSWALTKADGMNSRCTLVLIIAISLVLSVLLHYIYSGAYRQTTSSDRYTYWIGPVSTSVPFAFWALVTLFVASKGRGRPKHLLATMYGYVAGWFAMMIFSLWIIWLPKGPEHSSTIAIAVCLTPFLFVPIFPILFLLAYFIVASLWRAKHGPQESNSLEPNHGQ